jgi:hypothetical protein
LYTSPYTWKAVDCDTKQSGGSGSRPVNTYIVCIRVLEKSEMIKIVNVGCSQFILTRVLDQTIYPNKKNREIVWMGTRYTVHFVQYLRGEEWWKSGNSLAYVPPVEQM